MTAPASAPVRFWESALRPERLAGWIALAALAEFLGLRLLIRLGPLLPRGEATAAIMQGLIFAGAAALNVALLLAVAALASLAWRSSRRTLQYSLVAVLGLAAGLMVVGSHAPPPLFAAFVLAVLAAIGIAVGTGRRPPLRIGWLALFGLAYLALAYPTLGGTLHLALPLTPNAHALGELFAVLAAALALPALRPRADWRALVVSGAGAGLLAGLWISVPWLAPTLMIWSVAFTGYLPMPVYVLALGSFLYTIAALALGEGTRSPAWGLALIALGGLRWDVPYYALLALLGLLLLSGAARLTARQPIPESGQHALSRPTTRPRILPARD